MVEDIDLKIAELTKKADAAQSVGNYEAMREYDRQIKLLQEEKMKIFKSIIDSEKEDKPKAK